MPSRRSERPYRRSMWGQEAFPEVQERSAGSPGGQGGVRRPSLRFRKGRESFPEVWEGSGVPPGAQGGVEMPSRRSEMG